VSENVKGRRRTVYLTVSENRALEDEARRTHSSVSYLLRLAWHEYLARIRKGTT